MEHFDFRFHRMYQPKFDEAPSKHCLRLFGVDYIHLKGKQGGDLFVTRSGWPSVESLLPCQWFIGERFRKVGQALGGATGAVYRVPVDHSANKNFALVVKFSRCAQDIGLTIIDEGLHLEARERSRIEEAEFLSPFEEFGNLQRLKTVARSAIRTKQPLAIYSPPTRFVEWKLGRKDHLMRRMSQSLLQSQADVPEKLRIDYEWERLYILIYGWIDGLDAEQAWSSGIISEETMISIGQEARQTLRKFGWMVLDHKPRHVILRPRPSKDGLLHHNSKIAWALIDYELLVPL